MIIPASRWLWKPVPISVARRLKSGSERFLAVMAYRSAFCATTAHPGEALKQPAPTQSSVCGCYALGSNSFSVIHLSAMYPNRCQRSFRSKQLRAVPPMKGHAASVHGEFEDD